MTFFIGNYFEWSGSTTKRYYYAGGGRVAMRDGSTVYFLLIGHLGSTTITASSSGSKTAELRYDPWGRTVIRMGLPWLRIDLPGNARKGLWDCTITTPAGMTPTVLLCYLLQ
jgi:hypothetical protein